MTCGQLRNTQRYQKYVWLVRAFFYRVSYIFKPTVSGITLLGKVGQILPTYTVGYKNPINDHLVPTIYSSDRYFGL